jgi:uncharacterized protein YndB with AHSA1/START domain
MEERRGQIMMVQDKVERAVTIAAPVERVWSVITEPRHVAEWFGFEGKPVELDELRPGGRMAVDHGEYGVHRLRIVTVDEPRLFSWRWAPHEGDTDPVEGNSTLVEFSLTPEGDGTLLRVVETGFAGLPIPEDRRRSQYEDNSGGWTEMAERVRRYVETGRP